MSLGASLQFPPAGPQWSERVGQGLLTRGPQREVLGSQKEVDTGDFCKKVAFCAPLLWQVNLT